VKDSKNIKNRNLPLLTFPKSKKKLAVIEKLLDNYLIKDMNDWRGVNADLVITDPPFGIGFDGKPTNYHRKSENVGEGYVEC
jgi:hypothetical protein